MTRVVVEADGGSRGNPGPAGYGAVVLEPGTRAVLAERYGYVGVDTNNVAEYSGLIAGLEAAAELGATAVDVQMDSKLVVEQMSGRWQVKNEGLRPLARRASALLGQFEDVTLTWIPRERNKLADALANRAMDEASGAPARSAPASSAPPAQPSWTPPTGKPSRFVLVRHGSTEHSVDRRMSGRNDLPLSEAGREQARALARRAPSLGTIDAVVSSPLPRAVETATAVADVLGLTVEKVDGLIEADFGEWEGLTGAEIQQGWAAEYAAWLGSPQVAPPGGESFEQVTKRVRSARNDLIRRFGGQRLVVVSHVTPIKTLIRLALDAPYESMFRIHLDTASVSIVDYFDNGATSVRLVNDSSHLDVG